MTYRHSTTSNISSLTTCNTPHLVTFSPRRIVVTFHAWAGVFGAWRTSCWHRHRIRNNKQLSWISQNTSLASRYRIQRLRHGKYAITNFLAGMIPAFPFSNLFLSCVHTGLDIDGCCGASTPVIHCLPSRRLVGVAVSSPFTILTLASGHTFLSVAACILKDFLVS